MKRSLFWALAVIFFYACIPSPKDGNTGNNGQTSSETYRNDLQFDAIAIGVPSDTRIIHSDSSSYHISGNESDISRISVGVKKGCLTFDVKGWRPLKSRIDIVIKAKDIKRVRQSGSGTIHCGSGVLSNDETELGVSGSGRMIAKDLRMRVLRGDISGSGELDLSGEAEILEVSVSGSGDVKGKNMMSNSAEVVISGSGTCEVGVEKELKAVISGSGNIIYHGEPRVQTEISGSGDVIRSK